MSGEMIACVDPGKHGCGFALYIDGALAHAEYAGALGGQVDLLLEPVEPVALLLHEIARGGLEPLEYLVIEEPQIYDPARQVGRQEDLIRLALVVGAVAHAARQYVRRVERTKPAPWKGQVPPDVLIERIRGKLSAEELAAVELPEAEGLQHNVWDAVGLGLWRCGRLGR